MSPLFPIPVEEFGGLDLDNDPTEVGFSGAIDMCDVELDRAGRVRSRDLFSSVIANTALTSPSIVGVGGSNWIASTSAAVKIYPAGVSAVAPCQYFNWTVVPFGTPTTSYVYMADQLGVNAIRRLTTAGVISAPAGMPTAQYLTRTSTDNRLVAAFVGAGGPGLWNPHRVQFSNPGDAETWSANNYVDLDPGDNEQISGAAIYGNSTYIFKQSKIFEFYGNSTDASGNPIFNYRAIRHQNAIAGPALTGPDGVYYFGFAGPYETIFRLNQSGSTEVGRPIRLILSALAPSTFTPGSLTLGDIAFAGGQLRILGTNGTSSYCLSYDPAANRWTVMRLADSATYLTGYGAGNNTLLVAAAGANAGVHKLDPTNSTTDSLRAPSAYYQSGFDNLAPPRRFAAHYLFGNTRKRFRKWKVTGTGNVTLGIAHDMGSVGPTQALTLGTSPAIKDAWFNKAVRGQLVSYRLSSSTRFTVNKLTAYLAGSEPPLLGDPADV